MAVDKMTENIAPATFGREQESVQTHADDAQRAMRQDAIDFARASVGLEGFKPSEAVEALAARYVNGEIGIAEFVGAAKTSAQSNHVAARNLDGLGVDP